MAGQADFGRTFFADIPIFLPPDKEKFCLEYIAGGCKNASQAYRLAYPDKKYNDKTVWEKASKLKKDAKVMARLQQLQDKADSQKILSATELKEKLSEIVKSTSLVNIKEKLKAIDMLLKCAGEYKTSDVSEGKTINIIIDKKAVAL